MDISKLKVVDLKKELKTRGLSTIGTKNELMERLQEALQEDDTGDNGALDNDDLLDEEAVLAEESDEAILEEGNVSLIAHEDDAVLLTPTTLSAPKTSVEKTFLTTTKDESVSAPKKIILNRKASVPITSSTTTPDTILQEAVEKNNSNQSDDSILKEEKKVVKLGSLSAEERAKLRAQKFGVPIPDSVKKAVRAERFGGTQNSSAAVISSQAPDNDKFLKRQARFGIVSAEVDEKKQKRTERFGSANSANSKVDEQKRKRAERFGLA